MCTLRYLSYLPATSPLPHQGLHGRSNPLQRISPARNHARHSQSACMRCGLSHASLYPYKVLLRTFYVPRSFSYTACIMQTMLAMHHGLGCTRKQFHSPPLHLPALARLMHPPDLPPVSAQPPIVGQDLMSRDGKPGISISDQRLTEAGRRSLHSMT